MPQKRTGEILAEQLIEWDINHIYGMPGDSINEFAEDLRKYRGQLDFIQIRHEEVGALAASSYAKLTGKIGACMSIAGPGAIHTLNGLYDASKDNVPVLAIVGQVSSTMVGTDAFQEVNLERLFDDVAVFNERAQSAEQLPDMLNLAIRSAYTKKGVSVLIIPDDLFATKQDTDKERLTAPGYSLPKIAPDEDSVAEATELLRNAEKPVILAGKGVKNASKELIDFAETIKSPIVVSLLGKGVIPDYHELNLGQHGQIGTKPAFQAIMETDLLLLVGTTFPYREFLPDNTDAIQIETDSSKIGNLYPITVGLCGDAKRVLPTLTSRIPKKEQTDFLTKYQGKMKKWHTHMQELKKEGGTPLQAEQVMYALEKNVEKDAVISADVGNVTVWVTRYFPFTSQEFVISGKLATMGSGLPGAIAGKIANPDKQVIAICGDGGFSMVMHDFITAVKYNLPVKIIILNNSKIGMIKYEQQEMGHLNYATEMGEIDFAKFAEACGGDGYRVEQFEDLSNSIEQAMVSNKPAIVDVAVEDKAPLPGKITYDQAISYGQFLIRQFFSNQKVEFPEMIESVRRM